jgi:hypothetical protein
LVGSVAVWYWAPPQRYVHPTEFYYWTQGDEAGIDIRSPTRRAIVEMDAVPLVYHPNYREAGINMTRRCNIGSQQVTGGPLLMGALWRDVQLCNAAALKEEQFTVANSYFRFLVDEHYSRMHAEMAIDLIKYLCAALLMWLSLLLLWWLYTWIASAPTAKQK